MIFCPVVISLDRQSIYFPLFRLDKCVHGRTVSTFCFSSSAENKRADSNPVQPWSSWSLMASTQIWLYGLFERLPLRAHTPRRPKSPMRTIGFNPTTQPDSMFNTFKLKLRLAYFDDDYFFMRLEGSKINSRWKGVFYIGEWVKINSSWVIFIFFILRVCIYFEI